MIEQLSLFLFCAQGLYLYVLLPLYIPFVLITIIKEIKK